VERAKQFLIYFKFSKETIASMGETRREDKESKLVPLDCCPPLLDSCPPPPPWDEAEGGTGGRGDREGLGTSWVQDGRDKEGAGRRR
jgi:hypothetical protein